MLHAPDSPVPTSFPGKIRELRRGSVSRRRRGPAQDRSCRRSFDLSPELDWYHSGTQRGCRWLAVKSRRLSEALSSCRRSSVESGACSASRTSIRADAPCPTTTTVSDGPGCAARIVCSDSVPSGHGPPARSPRPGTTASSSLSVWYRCHSSRIIPLQAPRPSALPSLRSLSRAGPAGSGFPGYAAPQSARPSARRGKGRWNTPPSIAVSRRRPARPCRLRLSDGAQRNIGPALHPSNQIPFGFAMPR